MTWIDIDGWFDYSELYDHVISRAAHGRTVRFVEVGCWMGRSAAYMASKIKESGKHIHLYCVDTWEGAPLDGMDTHYKKMKEEGKPGFQLFQENIESCGLKNYLIPIVATSVRASNMFPDNWFDFVFIDGDHSYKSVTEDIGAWLRKVKPGGILAGHDYNRQEVLNAVHDFFRVPIGESKKFGPGETAPANGNLTCWIHQRICDAPLGAPWVY